jgi:integrase/recombinase XerD
MNRLHSFDVLTAWYREYMGVSNYRPRTVRDYSFEISFFRRWLESETDAADVDEITPRILHDYAAALYDRGLCPKTAHHKLAALSSFFKAAYSENKLYGDLSRHIQLPRIGRSLPAGMLTEEETRRIFDYLETITASLSVKDLAGAVVVRDRAVFEVLYSTGMRRGEVTGLKLDDIDYESGLLFVRQGKGGKDRVVPIGEKSLEAVRRYVAEARSLFAAAGSDYLFVTRWGGRMGDFTIRQTVINVTQGAGIARHVKVHALRHTCATHMLNHGADIRYVQELLGHACLTSTQVYTHVSVNKLKETHRKYHPREQKE